MFYLRESSMHDKSLCSDHTRQLIGLECLCAIASTVLLLITCCEPAERRLATSSSDYTTPLLYVRRRITLHSERPSADRILKRNHIKVWMLLKHYVPKANVLTSARKFVRSILDLGFTARTEIIPQEFPLRSAHVIARV
jgi:hypothetical protein